MIGALAILVATATSAGELGALIDRAARARAAEDWPLAARLLEQVYAIRPAPEILFNRARAVEAMNDLVLAQKLYTKLRFHPEVDADVRDAATGRARAIGELLRAPLVLLEDAGITVDGALRPKGLVSIDAREAIATGDGVRFVVLALEAGRVEPLSIARIAQEATACLPLGGQRVRAIDGLEVDVAPRELCLRPGEHTLEIDGRELVRVVLAPGSINALPAPPAESASPIRTVLLLIGGAGAIAGGVACAAIAESERGTVLRAKEAAIGGVVRDIGQAQAFAAQEAGDRAATWGAVLLVSGAVLVASGTISFFLDQ